MCVCEIFCGSAGACFCVWVPACVGVCVMTLGCVSCVADGPCYLFTAWRLGSSVSLSEGLTDAGLVAVAAQYYVSRLMNHMKSSSEVSLSCSRTVVCCCCNLK